MRCPSGFESAVTFLGLFGLVMGGSTACEPSTFSCPMGQRLENDQCVTIDAIECDGGTIVGGVCTCPGDQVNDNGVCRNPVDPCDSPRQLDGTACELDGVVGACVDGRCGDICADVNCDDDNECTIDGECSLSIAQCSAATFEPAGTSCADDGVCDGAGRCVECTEASQCSDANPCTSDICGGDGSCANPNEDGVACALMPGEGQCSGGECVRPDAGCVPNPCDDDNQCTQNVCRGVGTEDPECTHPALLVDAACSQDGGTFCDGAGSCVECNRAGQCDDDNQCTQDECLSNSCGNIPHVAGVACAQDGGSFCDGLGNCVQCNKSADCPDDGNVCTAAVCETRSCSTLNVAGSCDFMGGAGVCDDGVCVNGNLCEPYPCEDRGPCIDSDCTPSTGACAYSDAPNGRSCSSGDYSGECMVGACDLCAAVECDDNNPCTDDGACNPATGNCDGSGNRPINTPCGDGLCDGLGHCVECNSANQCNDQNQCTEDECAGNSCSNFASDANSPCDQDGGEFCNGSGGCVECNQTTQCVNDGNVCTSPVCSGGQCQFTNIQVSCDFNGGTGNGICSNGDCVDADLCEDPYPCNTSGRPCIADTCNPANGACTYPDAPTGTVCPIYGRPGECVSGVCDLCEPVDCHSSNPCRTDDTCNPNNGRCEGSQHVPDGSSCGGATRVCSQGECVTNNLPHVRYSGNNGNLTNGTMAAVGPAIFLVGHAGFLFNFSPLGVDHEIEQVTSGWYEAQVAGVARTVAYAVYWDQTKDDDYSYVFNSQQLPIGSFIGLTTGTRDNGAQVDQNIGSLPLGYIPVLVGFHVDRTTDHNLKMLRVDLLPNGAYVRLRLNYEDNGGDDAYAYSVRWALVPSHRVRAVASVGGSSDGGSASRTIAAQQPILQAFSLSFTSDHHVDRVGVLLDPGQLYIAFSDHNNDDAFSYYVRWADLE